MERPRNSLLDLGRSFAAFGVIAIHLAPNSPGAEMIGQFFRSFVVSFFFVAAVYFSVRGAIKEDSLSFIKKQFHRLAIPCLCWTFIYLGLFLLKDHFSGKNRSIDWVGVIFYGQSAVHLYFIPVLIWMNLVVLLSMGLHQRRIRLIIAMPGIFFLALFAFYGFRCHYLGWTSPAALICLILAGYALYILDKYQKIPARIACLAGLIIWMVAVCSQMTLRISSPIVPLIAVAAGAGFYMMVKNGKLELPSRLNSSWLTCSYGIYLSHFAILECVEFLLTKKGILPPVYSVGMKLLLGALIFIIALLFTLCLRRERFSKKFLLGE